MTTATKFGIDAETYDKYRDLNREFTVGAHSKVGDYLNNLPPLEAEEIYERVVAPMIRAHSRFSNWVGAKLGLDNDDLSRSLIVEDLAPDPDSAEWNAFLGK